MAPRRRQVHIVTRPDQRAALTSPVRLEIVDALEAAGACTVDDLARMTGRPARSLYYHVHLLRGVGLLTESRPAGPAGRAAAEYRLVAPRLLVACDPSSSQQVEAALQTIGAAFRQTEREMRAALTAGDSGLVIGDGPARTLHSRRLSATLSPRALAEVNRHLDAIERIVAADRGSAPAPGGRAVALMLALTPARPADDRARD